MMFELLFDVKKSYNINVFSFRIRNFVTPIIESGAHTCTNHTVHYGTVLWGGAVPGTSCQATIAPSLRDISQQALASSPERLRVLIAARNDSLIVFGACRTK